MARRDYGTGSVYQRARDGKWVASVEVGWTTKGTRRRRTKTAETEAKARSALRTMLRDAEKAQAPTTGSRPTVRTWAAEWMEIRSGQLRPTTWQANQSQITQWIIPTIGHKRLDRLTPGDRRAVTRAMEAAGRSHSTITRCDAILGKMLKDAIIEGHQVPHAILLTTSAAAGESDRDSIPLPDALAILATASERPDASRWVAALLQGMRPAECLGLTWGAVDLEAGVLDVSWQLKPLPYRRPRDRSSGFRVPSGYVGSSPVGWCTTVIPR